MRIQDTRARAPSHSTVLRRSTLNWSKSSFHNFPAIITLWIKKCPPCVLFREFPESHKPITDPSLRLRYSLAETALNVYSRRKYTCLYNALKYPVHCRFHTMRYKIDILLTYLLTYRFKQCGRDAIAVKHADSRFMLKIKLLYPVKMVNGSLIL